MCNVSGAQDGSARNTTRSLQNAPVCGDLYRETLRSLSPPSLQSGAAGKILRVAAQDDVREREIRTLFNLTRPEKYGRADIDAVLELEGTAIPKELQNQEIAFELKSATRGKPTISTVRDFGLHHIEKWRPLHWLFGIYGPGPDGELRLHYCLYGSPARMRPWFDQMASYVGPDVALADTVPDLIGEETLGRVLGGAKEFGYEDARRLMKNQYGREDYLEAADLPNDRYSRAAMLEMLRERVRYVIQRGSTLNNPHIPASYFHGWEQITKNHAARLRDLVVEALTV